MKKLKLEELGRRSVEEYKQIEKLPLIIILDDIRSAYNVGAVFRSSDAFMVDRLCLCGITAKPPNREIHKTALGANESVEWTAYDSAANCISSLKEEGYQVLAVEQTAESIPLQGFKIKVSKKYALVFGNEVQGIGQEALELCNQSLEIPQEGTKHSLNVSVTAGIVLWEFFSAMRSVE